jgi:hypothetical protein
MVPILLYLMKNVTVPFLGEMAGCWGKISKRGYGVGEACPASTTSTPKIAQNSQKNNHLKG